MNRGKKALCALALVLFWHTGVRAEEDSMARARAHFEVGRGMYRLGNYSEALREFSAGYQLAPKPQFLINLGQCYRKLNQLTRAHQMYEKFLAEAPPNDPERESVKRLLAETERQ